jgi:[ribosomal protein S18]-alanine N-acetyltransferase
VIGSIEPASAEALAQIAGWSYEPPYDFYDGRDEPGRNPERFFSVFDEADSLLGFYYFELRSEVLEYGLGLRPDLTGHRHGLGFVQAGLEFGRTRFHPARIVLAVAAFNARAITVYERAGFQTTGTHVRSFPRFGEVEFVDMEEAC